MGTRGKHMLAWWILYPLVGLDITDEESDLEEPEPLFGDATLLSHKHVQTYMDKLALAHATADFLVKDSNRMRRNAEPYSSFIAVRRFGDARQNNQNRNRISRETSERAYQIAALLNLTILAHWLSPQTIALVAQLHRGTDDRIWINPESGQYRIDLAHISSFAALGSEGLKWSRDDLRRHLQRKEFASFTRAFDIDDPSYGEGLLVAVREAAVRLADAIHTISPASRLLGAVTSLEILLDSQPKFNVTQERLLALLGRDLYRERKAEVIFKARHDYVHRGQSNPSLEVADHSIYLALAAILRFSTLSAAFQSKEDSKGRLRSYLDFVHDGMNRWVDWNNEEHLAFRTFLKHDFDATIFPYEDRPEEQT